MDMLRQSMNKPGEYREGEFPPKRGPGMTYCKHLKAVFDKASDIAQDQDTHMKNLSKRLLSAKDPELGASVFDAENWRRRYNAQSYQEFKSFVQGGKIPSWLQREVLAALPWAPSPKYIHDLYLYSSGGQEGKQKRYLDLLMEAPSVAVMILIMDAVQGKFNETLVKSVYQGIEDMFGTPAEGS